ncbi:VOC family protein [Mucilaginibacter sp. AW1-3]
MISGLYETHLFVEDLQRSIVFYRDTLGLELAHIEPERKIAFFWIGKTKEAMLGLWEKPKDQIDIRHFAFTSTVDDVLNNAVPWLKQRGLKPYNFFNDGTERPMVFAWMPAIAIYFDDPDGHCLEFIAILEGDGRADLGVISYEEWVGKNTSD